MARPTFPNFSPRFSPNNKEKARNTIVQFGDGYDLIVGDGLNTIRRTKSLEWEPISYSQMAIMVDFLRSRANGEWFYYHTDEDPGLPRKFTCYEWDFGRVPDTLDLWYLRAEFNEIFRTET